MNHLLDLSVREGRVTVLNMRSLFHVLIESTETYWNRGFIHSSIYCAKETGYGTKTFGFCVRYTS